MDYILDGYFEEEDAEDFYFKWSVKKIISTRPSIKLTFASKAFNRATSNMSFDKSVAYISVKKIALGKVEHFVEIIDKENNEHIKEIHLQQTYSIEEYLAMLKKAGFNDIEYYGEFEKYHDESQRIIFICHKRRDSK